MKSYVAKPAPTAFRALQLFETMPAEHIGVVVSAAAFEPHLRRGEVAVVDTTDRQPQHGELFAVTMTGPFGSVRRLVQMRSQACLNDGGAFVGWFEVHGFARDARRPIMDGPIRAATWIEARCLGRVVGFMST